MLRLSLILLAALVIPFAPHVALADDPVVAGTAGVASWTTFLQSFGILFREGLEALLLCTALAAATSRAGSGRGSRAVWRGAGLAIVASLIMAWLVDSVLDLAPAGREAIEGLTMLLAAAVLFYVSYWLLSKLEVQRWMAYLRQKVGRAENLWAIGAVAFLAVFREGAETVLFYEALAGIGRPVPIWGGFVAGALVLALVGFAVFRFGLKLPIRPLFAVTGGLLYLMAMIFAGQGVHELQETGWLSETGLAGAPRVPALGIYPTVETLVAQAALVALAIAAALVLWTRVRSSGAAEPAAEPRREPAEVR
ncbi:MAG: FTR1 family iron permease [Gemmatimonadota bacterium]